MARRYKVTLRKNGAVCGEAVYATRGEALSAAAAMKSASSGIEAVLAQMDEPATNPRRRRRRNPDWTEAELVAFLKGRPEGITVKELVYGFGGTAQGHTKRLAALVSKNVLVYEPWAKGGGHYRLALRRNPSMGRGTKHRDTVAEAIEKKLRREGESKAEARSRAFAIATAAEQRRQGLRANPTPIDVASLDFAKFKATTKIDGFYNVRTGRRFARVMSKDGTFVTDVPVKDGTPGESGVHGADAIKRRAYEQLRIHLKPSAWKPSVRVNPGPGRVPYKGAAIKIEEGTYTVEPHGATFSGPGGFVAAKKWIEKNV